MRNPLQEQLLKAGLVKKSKVAEVAREHARQRHGKAPPAPSAEQTEAERVRLEKAERDRALAAERNAQARLHEQRAQARQIVEQNKLKLAGEIAYAFTDEGVIRNVLVDETVRKQLASGALVIVRHDQGYAVGYAVISRAAADKVYARDAAMVVLDHGKADESSTDGADDDYYSQFKVPDDLIW
ncbi:DUF2058 domain-containing protein [Pseudoxanthomonas sacheonensis]|uniref:DUF2058 domain-containing protein n=1 Tax=Pseudoxanthomonas sacheonensis TaxID=443615 RepID=UPI0013D6472F|nr:DUF2058 domain-containing protein [Pseudoxanthomonas sacheonensis]KAF1708047.1 nucleoprotein/polynucleotide-associated enzyme [Pseudoxanthomonas sacheonensis]